METITQAILVPADPDRKPMVVPVADLGDIQHHVGGTIDAVTTHVDAVEFGRDNETGFVLVGYVHDEGLLLGMPTNHRATVMFQRPLAGDVLVLSGTNPTNGDYDGANYDVPGWYTERVLDGTLDWVIANASGMAEKIASAIELALQDGVFTTEEITQVMGVMEAHADGHEIHENDREAVNLVVMTCLLYYKGRQVGAIPKHDERGLELLEQGVTDDMIRDFLGNSEDK